MVKRGDRAKVEFENRNPLGAQNVKMDVTQMWNERKNERLGATQERECETLVRLGPIWKEVPGIKDSTTRLNETIQGK